MRLVLQRVSSANVTVWGQVIGEIRRGIVVLAAVGHDDTSETAAKAARKVAELRIFADMDGKMNRSVQDIRGEVLVVSQFTLLGDTSKGRRPSFVRSAPGEVAEPLVQELADQLKALGLKVAQGRFGADMQVHLVNDGPVTLVIDV
ncbi:MAG TPA: D-aminoacyl-tRNA deacylase [Actinomycetota bacterium]|nr:D-aminoacyl-tRNA deacylase [Actinomycetota bacterium]